MVGLGVMVRDHEGYILLLAGKGMKEDISVLQAEAWAVRFRLQVAYEAGFRLMEVEMDNLTLFNLLQVR